MFHKLVHAQQTHYYQKPFFKLVDGKLSLFACPPSKNALSLNDLSHISSKTIDKGARYPFLSKFATKLNLKEFALKFFPYQPFPEYKKKNLNVWDILEKILINWRNESNDNFSIFVIPPYQYVEEFSNPNNFNKRFSELETNHKMKITNPLHSLLSLPLNKRREIRFPIDTHFSPKGHLIYSKLFKKHINRFTN